jgi:nucleoside phosphorylase
VSGWSSGLAWADDSPGSAASPGGSDTADTADTAGTDGAVGNPSPSDDNEDTADATVSASTGVTGTVLPPKTGTVRSARTTIITTTTPPHPSESAAPTKTDSDGGSSGKPAKPKRPYLAPAEPAKTETPAPNSGVVDTKHNATPPATATAAQTTDAINRVDTNAVTEPTGGTEVGVSLRTASIQSSAVATPRPPAPGLPRVVDVVSRLVSGVVNTILSPFAASATSEVPADAPSMWGLLAFARREFEAVVRYLTGTPADAQTTSETLVGGTAVQAEQRTLILTAFPAEADAILARTTLDPTPTVVVDGHHFYLGSIGDKKVIVAMTGIGMVNATQTTETAFDHFTPESGISIGAVVFSGVAGGSGRTQIGSVAVPARWTSDDGATWHAVDPDMLAAANSLTVDLLSTDTIGDPACYCGLFAGPQIDLMREPQLFVGGDGSSDDNNNGTAFPAIPSIPLIGDIFGPQPCAAPDFSLLFTGNFFQAIVPFLAFGLLSNLAGLLNPQIPPVDAVDQETAAAQQVADAHGVPFLGIRGMSDGPGDPLNLPGYPFTFFVYKQIAADNAAIVTEAFLQNWAGPDSLPSSDPTTSL